MTATKHTPLIRLQAARGEYRLAQEACPHWGYLDGSDDPHECCYRVMDAARELRAAKRAADSGERGAA